MTARSLLDRAGTLLGLILVAVIFGVLVGAQFFAPGNIELMARQAAIVCMAALGMTVVIATGGIDLSVGSIIALSTVVIALALADGRDPPVWRRAPAWPPPRSAASSTASSSRSCASSPSSSRSARC